MGLDGARLARRAASAGLSLAVGVCLLIGEVPRTIGAIVALPGKKTVESIRLRQDIPAATLESSAQSLVRKTWWHEDAETWANLGLVYLILRRQGDIGQERAQRFLAQSNNASERSLMLRPANPYTWARLTYGSYSAGDDPRRIARLLRLSLLTGPAERRLAISRLDMGFRLWRHLSESDRNLLAPQVRMAFRPPVGGWETVRRPKLIDLAVRHPRASPFIRRVLAQKSHEDLIEFVKSLRAARKRKRG